jgi:uncharacterized phage protein (TIGR02218 family)
MRALDPAFEAALTGGATTLCSCWLIVRRDGARLGVTDHDRAIVFDGVTFTPEAALGAEEAERAAGLSVDSLAVGGALSAEAIAEADLRAGRYDGAEVTRWRIDWRDPVRRAVVFRGRLGEVVWRGGRFAAELIGAAAALNRPNGRAFLAACDARVGDARCGVDPARPTFSAEATVVAVATGGVAVSGLGGFAAGWFSRGRLHWLTGAAAGLDATIATHARRAGRDELAFLGAPDAPVAVGDRARVEAGCDGRFETCREKFANGPAFRGFPHMPGDGWLAAGATETDGGSRHG